MSHDWSGKPSDWPETITCDQDGCEEDADLVQDQGGGYCIYICPVHDSFGVQFDDDDDEDFDDDWDFDPYDEEDDL